MTNRSAGPGSRSRWWRRTRPRSSRSRARKGTSFIVQGPPGTGKSQTVTNLIADYVARGKRVLFVCEKRAAIDVVYDRLRQLGLDRLTTLIHDPQADKKSFVASLKESYEAWMAAGHPSKDERQPALDALVGVSSELERFDALMTSTPERAAGSLVSIVRRSFELPPVDGLSARDVEKLPAHQDLVEAGVDVEALARVLTSLGEEPVLARHPARLLHDRALGGERPAIRRARRRPARRARACSSSAPSAFIASRGRSTSRARITWRPSTPRS